MLDNKLTDNEIIKALKICSTIGASCKDCPAFVKDNRSNCKDVLIGALDIIDRLQVQNKDLTETVHNLAIEKDALCDKSEELKAEVERLNALVKTKNKLIKGLDQSISYAYDRAIKEFAERLKHSFFDNGYESPDVDFDYFVDNLVKEMIKE